MPDAMTVLSKMPARISAHALPVVLTVGHSTRPLEEFIALLKTHAVTSIIDVRTVPRSRHNPQFNRDSFQVALEAAGIGYVHVAGLGAFATRIWGP
jgi:uncharacterized protein (DUF488 family)